MRRIHFIVSLVIACCTYPFGDGNLTAQEQNQSPRQDERSQDVVLELEEKISQLKQLNRLNSNEQATLKELRSKLNVAEATNDDLKQELADLMCGSFSSKEQADQDPRFFDVHLNVVRIWPEREGEYWLYVEQAMATALDRPYRQRVYHLDIRDGEAISRIFNLPDDPLDYAGAWKKPERFKDLTPEQLEERIGCEVFLARHTEGGFKGSTRGKGCVSNLRGASYTTSKVRITEKFLESWDQGFNAEHQQVWGAEAGPYRFIKQNKD